MIDVRLCLHCVCVWCLGCWVEVEFLSLSCFVLLAHDDKEPPVTNLLTLAVGVIGVFHSPRQSQWLWVHWRDKCLWFQQGFLNPWSLNPWFQLYQVVLLLGCIWMMVMSGQVRVGVSPGNHKIWVACSLNHSCWSLKKSLMIMHF